jgi:TDG/mug DNA glycosylase family protein
MTSELLQPRDAPSLISEGVGFTSLLARATRTAAELTRAEQCEGAAVLARNVGRWKPRVVALLGLTLFPIVFPESEERGAGLKNVRLHGARVFVLPNPSGRNRAYPGGVGKLSWYVALAKAFLARADDDNRSPCMGARP